MLNLQLSLLWTVVWRLEGGLVGRVGFWWKAKVEEEEELREWTWLSDFPIIWNLGWRRGLGLFEDLGSKACLSKVLFSFRFLVDA